MRLHSFIILMMISIPGLAQVKFQKAYFISNDGEKTECLIRNQDWHKNPEKFQYKFSEAEEPQEKTIQEVQVFQVYNYPRYERHVVQIDKSLNQLRQMSNNRAPDFEVDTLFLKTIVEGEAILYEYYGNQIARFFYRIKNETPQQLIYKKFLVNGDQVQTNTEYKSQLWENFKCEKTSLDMVDKTDYNRKELTRYFAAYNECFDTPVNTPQQDLEKKLNKDLLHLSIRPGLRFTNFDYTPLTPTFNTDFDTDLSLRLGAELELFLPFNRNKWSIIFEPTYQSIKISGENENSTNNPVVSTIDYSSIELPIGFRHSMYLSEKTRFFINFIAILDIKLDGNFQQVITNVELNTPILTSGNFGFGAGFTFGDRVGLEFRYLTKRNLIDEILDSLPLEIVVGYRIF